MLVPVVLGVVDLRLALEEADPIFQVGHLPTWALALLGGLPEQFQTPALERRHGPMVLGVCRRVLRNHHDAEDAFQATFLVLVRKAASILPREKVGSWLYGVAYHAALKARATAARRRARERQVRVMPQRATVSEGLWHDLEPLLDQELARLPDHYRLPVVLCNLEGKTRKEAARQLGWPEGTVAGRLARGRALLTKRLTRHGLPVSGGVLAAVLSQSGASVAVPMPLVHVTVGKAVAGGVVSAPVAAIAEGVMKAMLLTKLKIVTAVLLALAVAGSGVGVLTHRALAAGQAGARKQAEQRQTGGPKVDANNGTITVKHLVVEAVDATQNTLTVATGKNLLGLKVDLLEKAPAKLDGAKFDFVNVAPVKFDFVKEAPAKPNAVKFDFVNVAPAKIDFVNVAPAKVKGVMLVAAKEKEMKLEGLPVAKDARIVINGKAGKLSDLKAGMRVTLELGTDGQQMVVKGIRAD